MPHAKLVQRLLDRLEPRGDETGHGGSEGGGCVRKAGWGRWVAWRHHGCVSGQDGARLIRNRFSVRLPPGLHVLHSVYSAFSVKQRLAIDFAEVLSRAPEGCGRPPTTARGTIRARRCWPGCRGGVSGGPWTGQAVDLFRRCVDLTHRQPRAAFSARAQNSGGTALAGSAGADQSPPFPGPSKLSAPACLADIRHPFSSLQGPLFPRNLE